MSSKNNKLIVKNTLMLYFRHMLILLVSLYTVRVVLNVLGVEDYGIYNVVGGIVTFFSFLSGTMASASQRYFSFAIGEENFEKLKKTFTVNWIVYAAIAIIAFTLLETLGLWFVNERLNVPEERFEAARLIFHFSVLAFLGTIIRTPFMAMIIAHEDMHVYAYVSIFEAIMKLVTVVILIYLPWDKLELYGMLVFGVTSLTTIIYIVIAKRKYPECQFSKFYWDKQLMQEILRFTGWTLFGQISTIARKQSVTILLNQVFNPIVVAARAIAVNITSHINVFAGNFNVGLYPPIIKSFASKDMNGMYSLVFNGSKITFYLMWIVALPFYLEMDSILKIWLKEPPPEAVLFTRLAVIEVLIHSISSPLSTAARAPGRMKIYELVLGSIQISIFFASWLVLRLGGAAYSVFIVAIFANVVMFLVRLLIVKSLIGLEINSFLRKVLLPVLRVAFLSAIASYTIHHFLPVGIIFSGISIFTSIIISLTCIYFVGLDRKWRKKVIEMILIRIKKFL